MKVLVIGGGYAGVACVSRLSHRLGRQGDAEITLINDKEYFVERIRLHQAAVGQPLPPRPLASLMARSGVRLVVGRVTTINVSSQTVQVGSATLEWDRLVLALGSHAGRFDVAGSRQHAFSMEAASMHALLARLRAQPAQASVAVVGAGLTGVEAAAEIAEAFPALRVQLLSRGTLLTGWSDDAQEHVRRVLSGLGVELLEGVSVAAVAPDRLSTSLGERPHALCLWTAGFELPQLARESGIAVAPDGRVRVDSQLRSVSHPQIFAAGDLAAPLFPAGAEVPMGCKSALPSGAHVAENLAREVCGRPLVDFDFALPFYCVSLGRQDGLIQWPDAEGRLRGRVITGGAAAQFKESVCNTTWRWLEEESCGLDAIRWQVTGSAVRRIPPSPGEALV